MSDFKLLDRNPEHRLAMLQRNKTLCVVSTAALRKLAMAARPLRLGKGAVLWHEGEQATQIACVVHGSLLVQKADERGQLVYYYTRRTGEMLGHLALALAAPETSGAGRPLTHVATIAAREQTIVLVVSSLVLETVLAEEPHLARRMLWDLNEALRLVMEATFSERTQPARALLAARLLGLAVMEAIDGDRVYLPYSQVELSRFTGLGARNINQFLAELPGVRTKKGRRGIQIESMERLRTFVRASLAGAA